MLRASLPRGGTGNGLEVFSSSCQANVGSCRTRTPWKSYSEMSTPVAVSTTKPMLRASLPREGTGNGLEVFSSTCQANVGSWRTGTPRKTDSEKSFSLCKQSVSDSTLKKMMGASLDTVAQEMAWRSSQGRVIQFWAPGRLEIRPKSPAITAPKLAHFRVKTSVFSRFSVRGDTPHSFGVFLDVFHSILGTRGSQIGPKSVRFQKFAYGTLIYFTCFDGLPPFKCNFEALIWICTQPIN